MSVPDWSLRRLALPLCVLGSPPVFLLYREGTTCGTPAGCSPIALGGYALLAPVAPVGAWLVARSVASGRAPAWLAPRPDDRTLAILGAVVAGIGTFLLATAADVVPGWLGDLLAPAGTLLGLPLVVVHAMLVGVGNAVGEPSTAVQLLVVAVGIALSGAWWYLLAKTAARGLPRASDVRE